jgi:hypothetical protein
MVVRVALRELDARAEFPQAVFEALRRRDAANGADEGAAQPLERQALASEDVLQMERLVRALDDLGRAVVEADALDELVVRLAGALVMKM